LPLLWNVLGDDECWLALLLLLLLLLLVAARCSPL
jgi:hypothetical protein